MASSESLGILIIGGEPETCSDLSRCLSRLGHVTLGTALSTVEAVQFVKELNPDLILVDLNIPGPESGGEGLPAALAVIQQIRQEKSTPAVLVTPLATAEFISDAIVSGVGAFVPKPIRETDLEQAIWKSRARFREAQQVEALNRCLATANEQLEHEIEERKRSEDLLRKREARHRAMLLAIPDLIFRVNRQGFLLDFHLVQCEDLAFEPDRLLGAHVGDIFQSPELHQKFEKHIRICLNTSHIQRFTYQIQSPHGILHFEARIAPSDLDEVMIVARDITHHKKTEEKLLYLSTHDGLTGLHNRHYFQEELARLEHSRLYPITTIIIDVDGLKKVNDSLGHAAGDASLLRTAQVLRAAFRAEDLVARIGGDEFAIILPKTDIDGAEVAIERIRFCLEAHNNQIAGPNLRLSFGYSTGNREEPVAEILHRADERMYQHKQRKSGENRSMAASG